jgi:hypothetical protein
VEISMTRMMPLLIASLVSALSCSPVNEPQAAEWTEASVAAANPNRKCPEGFDECDNVAKTKCETNIAGDPLNCGGCNVVCPSGPNANAVCQSGVCAVVCQGTFADCDPNAPGCETDTNADPLNCGACNVVCPSEPNADPVCQSQTCSVACQSGFADCDLNQPGCETNINDDPANCGACGNVCPSGANATPACGSGMCGLTCDPGFRDCDLNASTGCEVNINTDANNCGACGNACPFSTPVCDAGQCVSAGGCPPGTAECDNNPATVCETNTTSDVRNCGGCGLRCSPISVCTNSMCFP